MPSKAGKTTLNLGLGNFKGQSAGGVTIAHRLRSSLWGDGFSINAGLSVAAGNALSRVGGTWAF